MGGVGCYDCTIQAWSLLALSMRTGGTSSEAAAAGMCAGASCGRERPTGIDSVTSALALSTSAGAAPPGLIRIVEPLPPSGQL